MEGAAMRSVLALFILSFMMIGAGCSMTIRHAFAQDHAGHAEFHEEYKNWAQPGFANGSCCSARVTDENGRTTGDCFPTDARIVDDHWTARRYDGVWVDIPDDRVIHEVNPDPTGTRAHLCYNYGKVLCFVPPFGGG